MDLKAWKTMLGLLDHRDLPGDNLGNYRRPTLTDELKLKAFTDAD